MDSKDKEMSRRDFLAWAAALAAAAALPGCLPSSGSDYAASSQPSSSTRAYASNSMPTYVSVIDLNHPIVVPDPPPSIVINSGSNETEHYVRSPAMASSSTGTPYVHDLRPTNLEAVPWDGGAATPLAPVVHAAPAYQPTVAYQPVQHVQVVQALQPQPVVTVQAAALTHVQPIQAMQVQSHQLQTTSVNLENRNVSLSSRAPVAAPPGKVQVVSRASWSAVAANPSRMRPMNGVRRVTIHHEGSAKPNNDRNAGQVIETLRLIQGQHRKRMGAGDIGYHFIIDRTGLIWQGRDWAFQGAHSSGANANNLGVMLLGNFEIQQPTQAQLAALHSLVASLVRKYGLDPRTDIFGHADFCNTQCPGKHLKPQVAVLRRMR